MLATLNQVRPAVLRSARAGKLPVTIKYAASRPVRSLSVKAFKEPSKEEKHDKAEKHEEKGVEEHKQEAPPMMRADPYARFGRLPSIFQEMQREMDALMTPFSTRGGGLGLWDDDFFMQPFRSPLFSDMQRMAADMPAMRLATDVEEDDKAWTIKADIPGMSKEDIKLKLMDNTLTITGERKEEKHEGAEDKPTRYERRFGSFVRSFTLPKNVDAEGITATTKDGVLTVTIPKVEEQKPEAKEIPVA